MTSVTKHVDDDLPTYEHRRKQRLTNRSVRSGAAVANGDHYLCAGIITSARGSLPLRYSYPKR